MTNMKGRQNFAIVNVNNNTMPIINEDSKTRYAWIPFGVYGHDDFFAAVTMGLALAADLAPEYAILIGSIAGPLAKWAAKTDIDCHVVRVTPLIRVVLYELITQTE